MSLAVYRALAGPVLGALARLRAAQGKEDPARLDERFGRPGAARPAGRLVWLHGASVGESLAALTVWEALRARAPDLSALLTSGTRTSADLLAQRAPAGVVHQYLPIDAPGPVDRFLTHWRPDLGVFLESELWPTLLGAAAECGIPLALANARMTDRSLASWGRRGALARSVLSRFAWIGAADARTAAGLSALCGRPIGLVGNVKFAAPRPAVDPATLSALRAAVGDRPVWLAASTHEGEEESALTAHAAVRRSAPGALLILAPRHPERAGRVAAAVERAGFSLSRRSAGAPAPGCAVFVWDTMGELPLAYALAPVSLVGGSLVVGAGGHNPVEPAQIGSAILTGEHTFNFDDAFTLLRAAGGARTVTIDTLAGAVASLLADEPARAAMTAGARTALAQAGGALTATTDALVGLLDARR